jgi:hypothetical protein
MSPPVLDEDAMFAALDLVGRSGAKGVEFGHLHDDVPVAEAAWWAQAQYAGARLMVENHRGPIEALEALARKLLDGAMCAHCRGLVSLGGGGAMVYPGSRRPDGSVVDAAEVARLRTTPQCRWTRMGPRWVRGCEGQEPAPAVRLRPPAGGPTRGKRTKKAKRQRRRR